MAFTYKAYTTSGGSSTVFNFSKPVGTVNGDLMIAMITSYSRYSNSAPAGWIRLGQVSTNSVYFELYYKIAANEGAYFRWGFSALTTCYAIIHSGFGSFDGNNPIDVVSTVIYNNLDSICRGASMNVTHANSLLICCAAAVAVTTFANPFRPTMEWMRNCQCVVGSNSFYFGTMVWNGSGDTGTIDVVMTMDTIRKNVFVIALNPRPVTNIKTINGLPYLLVKTHNGFNE